MGGVGSLFAAAADAVRGTDPFTEWDGRHADLRGRQAARAAKLSAWGGKARGLALRLWEDEPRLDVETTELVVAAVLSEPPPTRRRVAGRARGRATARRCVGSAALRR